MGFKVIVKALGRDFFLEDYEFWWAILFEIWVIKVFGLLIIEFRYRFIMIKKIIIVLL